MSRFTRVGVMFCCALLALTPTLRADDGLTGVGQPVAGAPPVQTRDGVTVRIEKVSVDRIYNGAAWLRRQYGAEWEKHSPKDLDSKSFWVAQVFVSVSGDVKGTKKKYSYKLGTGRSESTRISGAAEFDPLVWQQRIPDIAVDEAAKGYLFWAVLEDRAAVDAAFPASANFEVLAADGKQVTFAFEGIALLENNR